MQISQLFKNAIIILTLVIAIGCTNDSSYDPTKNVKEVTFYLNNKCSNDTLIFQKEKYDKGNWNNTSWRITKDSIFQEDSHGLSYYLGTDRRKYDLKNDTLCIWTTKNGLERTEKFLLVKFNENELELKDLNPDMLFDRPYEIGSDLLLR
ncbi:MAG: hypothetical protein H6582_03570 [Crocinitomicaceae bacterium]|nr:hypothetical protein [Crocinitomicaceae bacterium]